MDQFYDIIREIFQAQVQLQLYSQGCEDRPLLNQV